MMKFDWFTFSTFPGEGDGSPCGHCRQWLSEFVHAPELEVIGAETTEARTLGVLFPSAFSPGSLGNTCPLLSRCATAPSSQLDPRVLTMPLMAIAEAAANRSYSPYTRTLSGVAIEIQTAAGQRAVGSGAVLESVAYDPTIDPLQVNLSFIDLSNPCTSVCGPSEVDAVLEIAPPLLSSRVVAASATTR